MPDENTPKKVILITGANGFVGKSLTKYISQHQYTVRASVRSEEARTTMLHFKEKHKLTHLTIHNVHEESDWEKILKGVYVVIHCAGRAHILNENPKDSLAEFRAVNTYATENLAKLAQRSGVKRFIFLSSIGVLGNCSYSTPFTENTPPTPSANYAISKLEAEQLLKKQSGSMDVVIIRPPLIYGPGAKGNFGKLLQALKKNIPLPLGCIQNKRHFLSINNLNDFIGVCIEAPKAANESFLVSDKESISTTKLIQSLSQSLNAKPLLLPVPNILLKFGLKCAGKSKVIEQLIENLEIDTSKAKNLLGWVPPHSLNKELKRATEPL